MAGDISLRLLWNRLSGATWRDYARSVATRTQAICNDVRLAVSLWDKSVQGVALRDRGAL